LVPTPEKVIFPEEDIPVAVVIAPEELIWNPFDVPTENKDAGDAFPIPTYPLTFLMVMATALAGAKIRSPVEALPICRAFMAVAPMALVVPAGEPSESVPAMEAIGLAVATPRTANLAEVVAVDPTKMSIVELLGYNAPEDEFQKISDVIPVLQTPKDGGFVPNRH
jgi:hypothetical protein